MSKKRAKKRFKDTFLIYFSDEDKCWVAHSLCTDEIGTGDCIINALTDGIKAVNQVIELAKERPDIKFPSHAPDEYWDMAKQAKALPREMYEIAFKRFHGDWPEDDIKPKFDIPHKEMFIKQVMETMPA